MLFDRRCGNRIAKSLVAVVIACVVFSLADRVASADAINGTRPAGGITPGAPPAGESTLQAVFTSKMTNPFTVSGVGNDQSAHATFLPFSAVESATIVIEIAGNANGNKLGIYSANTISQAVQFFAGADGAGVTVKFKFSVGHLFISTDGGVTFADKGLFDLSKGFGFYLETPDSTKFYTEDSNNGGDAHSLVYNGKGGTQDITVGSTTYPLGTHDWVFAFEDLPSSIWDRDYNDFVFFAQGLDPVSEPATLALLALGAVGLGIKRRRALAAKARDLAGV